MISIKSLGKLKVFLLILWLNPNEAFQGNLHGSLIQNLNSRSPKSGTTNIKFHAPRRIVTHSLILLRETGRSGGGVSEQVYKEFDQAVEINDLLLVEDLIMVLTDKCRWFQSTLIPHICRANILKSTRLCAVSFRNAPPLPPTDLIAGLASDLDSFFLLIRWKRASTCWRW
jgi:hypothetical protein